MKEKGGDGAFQRKMSLEGFWHGDGHDGNEVNGHPIKRQPGLILSIRMILGGFSNPNICNPI